MKIWVVLPLTTRETGVVVLGITERTRSSCFCASVINVFETWYCTSKADTFVMLACICMISSSVVAKILFISGREESTISAAEPIVPNSVANRASGKGAEEEILMLAYTLCNPVLSSYIRNALEKPVGIPESLFHTWSLWNYLCITNNFFESFRDIHLAGGCYLERWDHDDRRRGTLHFEKTGQKHAGDFFEVARDPSHKRCYAYG